MKLILIITIFTITSFQYLYADVNQEVSELKKEFKEIKKIYEKKIEVLKAKIKKLETKSSSNAQASNKSESESDLHSNHKYHEEESSKNRIIKCINPIRS